MPENLPVTESIKKIEKASAKLPEKNKGLEPTKDQK
jgi:hypothetical protein